MDRDPPLQELKTLKGMGYQIEQFPGKLAMNEPNSPLTIFCLAVKKHK